MVSGLAKILLLFSYHVFVTRRVCGLHVCIGM